MLVKSLSSKSMRFKQLLEYFNQPLEKGKTPILHNLTTQTDHLKRIEAEFLENSTYQKRTKSTVTLYHEILSWGELDKEKISEEILTELTRKYLEIRAPDALAYAKYQYNTENKHVHILISGNEYHSTKQVRLSKYDFQKVKQEMELYQQQRYPELNNSLIFDRQAREQRKQRDREQGKDQPDQIRRSWKEQEKEKRYQRENKQPPPSRKEQVRQQILTVMSFAMSEEQFSQELEKAGFNLYRRGEATGIEDRSDGRKYRFNTLGLQQIFDKEKAVWADMPRRMAEIEQIFLDKFKGQVKDLAFAEDVRDVLALSEYEKLDPEQRRRAIEIDQIYREKRQQSRDRGNNFGLSRSL